jgi:shikimate kinase
MSEKFYTASFEAFPNFQLEYYIYGGMKLNFILIGAPNSGKTTLGKKAAVALGMRFYDTDRATADSMRSWKQEPSFFHFLRKFPAAEEAVVRKIAKKAVNAIIATGAETALSPKNVQALRQCGRFIHIKRDPKIILDEIQKKGPPNPEKPEIQDADILGVHLYRNTMSEYERLADFTVENDGNEEAGLEKLVKIIQAEG